MGNLSRTIKSKLRQITEEPALVSIGKIYTKKGNTWTRCKFNKFSLSYHM